MAPRGKKTKATPVYQVFNISPANKGVRALTTFKPGDVIISEEPLFNLFLPVGQTVDEFPFKVKSATQTRLMKLITSWSTGSSWAP